MLTVEPNMFEKINYGRIRGVESEVKKTCKITPPPPPNFELKILVML